MAQTEVSVSIGGRTFEVACQEGEEQFLYSASALLDSEAQVLVDQIGRMPEGRMLLMAGLMLADKTAGLEERLREAQDRIDALQSELTAIEQTPPPEPERIEIPIIPNTVTDALAELAARAEALAEAVEEKASVAG